MPKFDDLLGTPDSLGSGFKIGTFGIRLKNSSGSLLLRNSGDTADAALQASLLNLSGNSLVINSSSAQSGADWKYTLTRPTSGMTANVTLTLPTTVGTSGQVLTTDGSGNLSFTTAGTAAGAVTRHTKTITYTSGTTVSFITVPAGNQYDTFYITIDAAFNGTTSISVGVSGSTSKYVSSSVVDLTQAATTSFQFYPNLPPLGSSENLIITFSASGSSQGSCRVECTYATPSTT